MGITPLPFAFANSDDLDDSVDSDDAQELPPPRSVGADRRTTSLPYRDLEMGIADWLSDSQYRDCTAATIAKRKILTKNLLWYLTDHELPRCGVAELKAFITYVRTGHEDPRGRWGNKQNCRPTSRVTLGWHSSSPSASPPRNISGIRLSQKVMTSTAAAARAAMMVSLRAYSEPPVRLRCALAAA